MLAREFLTKRRTARTAKNGLTMRLLCVLTLIVASGMDAKRTSMFLGHSQTSTTMNLYVHSVEQANESACDCLAKLLKTGLRP